MSKIKQVIIYAVAIIIGIIGGYFINQFSGCMGNT